MILAYGRRQATLRLFGLLALCLAGLMMLRASLAYVALPRNTALAASIDRGNAEVAAARAAEILLQNPANWRQAESLAREALRRSPVSATSARVIAMTRAIAGDPAGARRMIAYAEKVSRRDLPTQIWLIEDAVQRGDVASALHHHDIALRSSELAKPLLFPALINALDNPVAVKGIVRILMQQPAWGPSFLDEATRKARHLDRLATLLQELSRGGYILPATLMASAGWRMVEEGRYQDAWRVYSATHIGATPLAIRDPQFARLSDEDGPFGWTSMVVPGLAAELDGGHGNEHLTYRATMGTTGAIARQLLVLRPGSFRLSARVLSQSGATDAPVQVRLTCARSGQSIGSIAAGSQGLTGRFTVPEFCPAQWLEIVVSGGDSPLGTSGSITDVRLAAEMERQ